MGFRNPITTAEDPTARQEAADAQSTANNALSTANNALSIANGKNTLYPPSSLPPAAPAGGFTTGDQWIKTLSGGGVQLNTWTAGAWSPQQFGAGTLVAGAVLAGVLAADAVDGMTITGVTVRTGADGTARVRIYEGTDGKANPWGVIDLEDGVAGDTPARFTAGPFAAGGGGLTISGGAYTGGATKAAASLKLQTDQANLATAQITAPDGFLVNGGQLNAAARGWGDPRSNHTSNASDSFSSGSMAGLLGSSWSVPPGDFLVIDTLTLSAAATTVAYHRLVVNGVNVTADSRCDLTTAPRPVGFAYPLLNFAGGTLSVSASAQTASSTGTIFTAGSSIAVVYLGPRS